VNRRSGYLGIGFLLGALSLAACSSCAGSGARNQRLAASASYVTFRGMCDASGAVPLTGTHFAVADDEDNVLRVYDAARGGAPLAALDISVPLGIFAKSRARPGKSEPRVPEIDIEAATRLGELAFWIGSHGRSSSGKLKPERLRMFATSLAGDEAQLVLVGASYDGLLEALFADQRYAPFALDEAAQRAPKDAGGLNIEGMMARRAGGVFIGFRSPTPGDKALLAVLSNPEQVVRGEPARLGTPVLLALGGLGVRDLVSWHGLSWIIAGASGEGGPSLLYRWQESGEPERVASVDLSALHPEAFFASEALDRIMVLSDDGSDEIDGVPCKELDDAQQKRFRGMWLPSP
jgi:hypothetical protein